MGDNDGMEAGPVAELLNEQQFGASSNGPPTMGPEGLTGVPGQSVWGPGLSPFTAAY
jgi:hypothetical protein